MLSILTLAVLTAVPGVQPDGGFSGKCNQLSLCGAVLKATCVDDAGVAHKTSLDLNTCVGFIPDHDGIIWCEKDNGVPFQGGCRQCGLNGTVMWCPCFGDFSEAFLWNFIDLDTCIGSHNGQLAC
ncbi:hypothetical protein AURDEDRAFT_156157 [Auricularia subglabra TFB-10046 SS5]|nr:hypothetical protein AURDEDRAFT_156157 [Auricularia subglabra TFB-10046 SS5]